MEKMITTLEELSMNAWAALQTVLYDGWVIRFADGYTKRANSVNALYPSRLAVDEKIAFCENLYRERHLPTVFKMTSAVFPGNLDERLDVLGYQKDSAVSVQTFDLAGVDAQAAGSGLQIQEALSAEWLEGFSTMSAVSVAHQKTLQSILNNIVPRRCFVSLKINGRQIACGLGVLQSGHLGLFDIVTDRDFRGRGYARRVVDGILAWGKQNGAQTAYLQVVLDNTPALRLYSKIGFLQQYSYWYRIQAL